MTIKYEPSAAAISWLTLSDALKSRSLMEEALFSMFASTMKVSIDQTLSQSIYAKNTAADEAKQTLAGGLAQIVGGGLSLGITASFGNKAENLRNQAKEIGATDTEFSFKEVGPAKPLISDQEIELKTFGEEQAELEVDPKNTKQTAKETSSEEYRNQVKAEKAEKANLNREAKQKVQEAHSYSQAVNSFSQGIGAVIQAHYINQKGQDQAASAIAQGLGKVFDTETSQVNSIIQSCDSAMSSTNNVLQTIISVSAVRG